MKYPLLRLSMVVSLLCLLCLGCGSPEGYDRGSLGGGNAPSYTLISAEGEPVEAPMWSLMPGSRLGDYVVRGYRFGGQDFMQLTKGDETQAWRGWIKVTDAGVLEVGDLRHGIYPRARMLIPADPAPSMSFSTSPWGLADDRVVKMGHNSWGDSAAHNRETVVLERNDLETNLLGRRGTWERATDLHGQVSEIWVEGIGPLPSYLDENMSDYLETVILTEPQQRPETGPAVSLKPVMDGSLFADSFRPSQLDIVAQPDGSLQIHVGGEAVGSTMMVSDMGGGLVHLGGSAHLCLVYSDGDFYVQDEEAECPDPRAKFVRQDGSIVDLPAERVAHSVGGNLQGVTILPFGALVEEDGKLIHLAHKLVETRGMMHDVADERRVVTYPDGTIPSAGPWMYQIDDSGAIRFEVDWRPALWDGAAGFSHRQKAPRLGRWHLHNAAGNQRHFHVTADGRLRELVLADDGMHFIPIAQLELPHLHRATAAVWLEGNRYLVFTHTGDVGYDTQNYHVKEPGNDYMEWKIENEWVKPDFGDAHFWIAEVPGPALPAALPPISEAIALRRLGLHLEVCWPHAYGPVDPEGWRVAGAEPYDVLADDDRNCLLFLSHPGRIAPDSWVEGPLPGVGNARISTDAPQVDSGWVAMAWPIVNGPNFKELELVTSTPYGVPGTQPRLSHGAPLWAYGRGIYYRNDDPEFIPPPPEAGDAPGFFMGVILRLTGSASEPVELSSVPGDGTYVGYYDDPSKYPPQVRMEPAGVQGGGVIVDNANVVDWYGGGTGGNPFSVESPTLPTPEPPWRLEVRLYRQTLCGHHGASTIYCVDSEGEQREITDVAHLSERQWWITDRYPLPAGMDYLSECGKSCDDGRIWLLGADADHPLVSLIDPEAMTLTEVPLGDLLPQFPAAPKRLMVETMQRIVPPTWRPEHIESPYSLIGASTSEGPRWWLVEFGPEAPRVVWGPRWLEIPEETPWGAETMAEALPHLRPIQETDFAVGKWDPDAMRITSHVLGDVTDLMTGGLPAR